MAGILAVSEEIERLETEKAALVKHLVRYKRQVTLLLKQLNRQYSKVNKLKEILKCYVNLSEDGLICHNNCKKWGLETCKECGITELEAKAKSILHEGTSPDT